MGDLTIDYCSRTKGCCSSYCFLEIFLGGRQGCDGREQSRDRGDPPVPPARENPAD